MALPATDAFTSSVNAQNLGTYSASWVVNASTTGFKTVLASGDIRGGSSAGTNRGYHWGADTFNDDHYSQVKVTAVAAGIYIGPAVRCSSAAAITYYSYQVASDGRRLVKLNAATETVIVSTANAGAVNDVLKLAIAGSSITPIRNGSTDTDLGVQSDSALTTGYAGVACYNASATTYRIDDFVGDNYSASSSTLPMVMHRRFASQGQIGW